MSLAERSRFRAARRRWARQNAEARADGRCLCGKPGTVEHWHVAYGGCFLRLTCAEHAGLPADQPWFGSGGTGPMVPMVKGDDGVWRAPEEVT